jgi:5-methylcytosine-specific restriction endonuclease McrA
VTLKRKAPIQRGRMKSGTKALTRWTKLKPLNAERKGKRKARYAAYLKSPAWRALRREILTRAGHRCEMLVIGGARCEETTKLTVHHKTYARFGAELPTDLAVLCKGHHDAHHAATGLRPRGLS